MESSIIDQLRLQEGRLFQNEHVVALFLDVKAIVLESLSDVSAMANPTDEYLAKMEKSLVLLAPSGFHYYHTKSIYDSVRTIAKLLWPTEIFLVAKPKLATLLKGMCTRLAASEQVKNDTFITMDPIKQDFVIRETFRRTLVNDCLVIFEDEAGGFKDHDGRDGQESPDGPDGQDSPDRPIGPDDSVSQLGRGGRKPSSAHSAIGPVDEEYESASELGELPARPRYASSVAPSVAPRLISSMSTFSKASKATGSQASEASGVSGTTSTSVRQPLNIRKVHIEMDQ